MRERMELGMAYFRFAGRFIDVQGVDLRPNPPPGGDPVVAVIGRRAPVIETKPGRAASWRRR
jgi:hypothetical protein